MADAEFNPYAAPKSLEPGSVQDGLWQVSGSVLLFRDGARLPEVDLFTGRDDVPLTPASSEFGVAKGPLAIWLQWLWVPAIVGGYYANKFWGSSLVAVVIVVLIVSRVLGIFMKGSVARARLRWMVTTQGDQKTRGRNRIRIGLGVLGIGVFVATSLIGSRDSTLWGFGVMSFCLIVVAVMGFWSKKLECKGERDGWFTLKGIPKDGLSALSERQEEANRKLLGTDPKMRMRKVYAFNGYKAPLRDLLGMSWKNPILVLVITAMKLSRSKRLVRDHFHWSESADLQEKDWDAELVKLRDEWQKLDGSSGWKPLKSGWLGAPTGDVLTQCFNFVSPDGMHSIVGAVVRLATAHASGVIGEVTFRSWRSDGTLRITSNQRVQRPLPDGFDFMVKKGGVARVFEAHLAATRDEDLVPIGIPDEWESRMSEEAEWRRRTLEAAGIYGPVREEEFLDRIG